MNFIIDNQPNVSLIHQETAILDNRKSSKF